jgi:long-chain acyl-CoA synthetase
MALADATAWPHLSLEECEALLCAPGQRFEMETVEIDGVPTRVWKNAPPDLRALVEVSRTHGDRVASVLEEERVSFEAQYRALPN